MGEFYDRGHGDLSTNTKINIECPCEAERAAELFAKTVIFGQIL